MDITINSPGINWFNIAALKINGQNFTDIDLKTFKVNEFNKEIEIPEKMTRYEIDRAHYRKLTEGKLVNNISNLCEYYGITHDEIERLVYLHTGYAPGWLSDLIRAANDYKFYMSDEGLKVIAVTIDELAGFKTGAGLSLITNSTLYYGLGLVYSIDEMIYIVPSERDFEMKRNLSYIKVAHLKLIADSKYNRDKIAGKSEINFKRWYIAAEQE